MTQKQVALWYKRRRYVQLCAVWQARTTLIQLAWLWLRYQPGSGLSAWFRDRVGSTGRRIRKVMVVALARKLLIALWRFVIDGVMPEGAVMKPSI